MLLRRWLVILGALFLSGSSLAADFYVRLDGGTSVQCSGTENRTRAAAIIAFNGGDALACNDANLDTIIQDTEQCACAFASPNQCPAAMAVGLSDSCRIQGGTYLLTSGFTHTKTGGNQVGSPFAYNCTFTKGSTTVTCGSTPSLITIGAWVRAVDGWPYFSFTRVINKVGNSLILEEGYRGESAAGVDVESGYFQEYRGENGTVVLSNVTNANKPTFTQNPTYPPVYQYTKASASAPWNNPKAFRENPPVWNLWEKLNGGADPYIKQAAGAGCVGVCGYDNCAQQVDNVPGSWCDDGTTIYVHTRDGSNPGTNPLVEAGYGGGSYLFGARDLNYLAIRNLTFWATDPVNGHDSNHAIWPALSVGSATSPTKNLLLDGVATVGAPPQIRLEAGADQVDIRNSRFLNWILLTSSTTPHSGLRLYNVEVRGGYTNLFSMNALVGTSPTNRVIVDRLYAHRSFSQYYALSPGCNNLPYWNCTTKSWTSLNREREGCHGPEWGNNTSGNYVAHLLLQNSIIEGTGDGMQLLWAPGTTSSTDLVVRNNTFGWSGSVSDNFHPEIFRFGWTGSTIAPGTLTLRNNLFYADDVVGSNIQGALINLISSSWGNISSDYNAFIYPWAGSNGAALVLIYNSSPDSTEDLTFTQARARGYEAHSVFPCTSGCVVTSGVTNDGATTMQTGYFTNPDPYEGTQPNYTPSAVNKAVNAGETANCPTEDFYGNPRNDGACDIGAVERQPESPAPSSLRGVQALRGGTVR